ncbi:hypothetical protein [Xenorhabdus bovienii]|nr:hypothetical protein [Xenorhabdus bovienii]
MPTIATDRPSEKLHLLGESKFINNNQNIYGEYQYAEFYGELNKK